MTADEIKELKKGIFMTAKYYGRDLPGEVLSMMADDLADLGFSAVSNAYLVYRRNPKNKTMPLPAQIRDLIAPTVTPISSARAIVGRICEAIPKFGYVRSQEARVFIGEIGWDCVRRAGGWSMLCESDILSNPGRQAQMRDSMSDQVQYGEMYLIPASMPLTAITESGGSCNERALEFNIERDRQLKDFMNKFNLNSDLKKETT